MSPSASLSSSSSTRQLDIHARGTAKNIDKGSLRMSACDTTLSYSVLTGLDLDLDL